MTVTHVAVRCSIEDLQQYFVKQGFSNACHASLDMCTDRVFAKAACKMKQTTLNLFLA